LLFQNPTELSLHVGYKLVGGGCREDYYPHKKAFRPPLREGFLHKEDLTRSLRESLLRGDYIHKKSAAAGRTASASVLGSLNPGKVDFASFHKEGRESYEQTT